MLLVMGTTGTLICQDNRTKHLQRNSGDRAHSREDREAFQIFVSHDFFQLHKKIRVHLTLTIDAIGYSLALL